MLRDLSTHPDTSNLQDRGSYRRRKTKDDNCGQKAKRDTLSTRLKEAREYCGFTRGEVAAYLGLPRIAISLMESGARRVETKEIQRLTNLYQTNVDSLTGLDQESPEPESVRLVARATAELSVTDRRRFFASPSSCGRGSRMNRRNEILRAVRNSNSSG